MKRQLRSWGTFGLVVLAVAVFAGPTSLGGPASYVIVDGPSMEPTYYDGDLVIAYERESYLAGDVIVYDAPVDTQFNVIHRITEATEGGYITQGDNRDEVDGWIAPDDEIFGAALFHIPRGGAVVSFLRQPAAILGLLAGWLTLTYSDRRRREDEASDEDGAPEEPSSAPGDPFEPTSDKVRLDPVTATADASTGQRLTSSRNQTISLLAVAAVLGGTAGVFVAHAAMLNVDPGVLQTFREEVDIEVPETATHAIGIEVRFFNSGNKRETGRSPVAFEPIDVTAGQSFRIRWNGPGQSRVVDCRTDVEFPGTPPNEDNSGEGTFEPTADAKHVLCIETASGNVSENIDVAIVDGDDITQIDLIEVVGTDPATCGEAEGSAPCLDAVDNATSDVPEQGDESSRGEPEKARDSNGGPGVVDTDAEDPDLDQDQTGDGDGALENDGDKVRVDDDEETQLEKDDPGREPVADELDTEGDEPTRREDDGRHTAQDVSEDAAPVDGADGEDL